MITAAKRNAFSVTFSSSDILGALEPYVLAVDMGTELFNAAQLHRTNTLIVWLADDIDNHAMKAIRSHVELGNNQFSLTVKVMGAGDKVKDIYLFEHCQLNALQHSIFSHESQDETFELGHKYITHAGIIKPPAAREHSAKLLQIAFASMVHHITNDVQ